MTTPAVAIHKDEVVFQAFLKASENLGLSGADLEKITGFSESTISRMRIGGYPSDKKKRELVLVFLRTYRSLVTLVGDAGNAKEWLWSENTHLNGVPAELIKSVVGLGDVTAYLDAMRGKI